MAGIFKQIDLRSWGQRVKGVRSETANTLHRTLNGIVALIKLTLS